jgi:hypothetical protein
MDLVVATTVLQETWAVAAVNCYVVLTLAGVAWNVGQDVLKPVVAAEVPKQFSECAEGLAACFSTAQARPWVRQFKEYPHQFPCLAAARGDSWALAENSGVKLSK